MSLTPVPPDISGEPRLDLAVNEFPEQAALKKSIRSKDISVLINQISQMPRITVRKHLKTPCNNIEPQLKDFGPRAGLDHANYAAFIERIIHNTGADLINRAELEFARCNFRRP